MGRGGRKERRERRRMKKDSQNNNCTHTVSGIQVGSILDQELDNVMVSPHGCNMQWSLPILVGYVQRAACPRQTLHHILIAMPAATQ